MVMSVITTQINGLNQAVSNANDGISLAQTTESALNEVTNNLQRIRTLAVQSANGTNSDSDRASLNAEVQQRLAEINRIATQTNFNGRTVLDGNGGVTKFQVGANVGQTIDVDLSKGVKTDQMGTYSKTSASVTGTALTFSAGMTTLAADAAIDIGGKTATIAAGKYSVSTLQSAINGDITSSDLGLSNATASTDDSATLSSADVLTVAGANNMMQSVDAALQSVSDLRSDLGAVQNRFESTISNLQTISQNLSASRSQIQDADFAAETANMTSANILQQAGVSVLAQANASTQSVLKLLQ